MTIIFKVPKMGAWGPIKICVSTQKLQSIIERQVVHLSK